MLAPQINLGELDRGDVFTPEAQILKETVPERQQLIHIQAHGVPIVPLDPSQERYSSRSFGLYS